jgi:hypothetical protein
VQSSAEDQSNTNGKEGGDEEDGIVDTNGVKGRKVTEEGRHVGESAAGPMPAAASHWLLCPGQVLGSWQESLPCLRMDLLGRFCERDASSARCRSKRVAPLFRHSLWKSFSKKNVGFRSAATLHNLRVENKICRVWCNWRNLKRNS